MTFPAALVLAALAGADLRPIVVASDLHLGEGRLHDGHLSPYEDFRWGPEFAEFLRHVDAEGASAVDLVLAGDVFELWQGHEGGCPVRCNRDLGCSSSEAVKRLDRALAEHADVVEALRWFAARGKNRVNVVPGNHDAALLFPEVRDRLLAAFPGGRVTVPERPWWLSPVDGKVVVEHGHQVKDEPNRFIAWPAPFLKRWFTTYLRRPWGEQFVVDYYNPWEEQYPIIDNVSEELAGAKLAWEAEGPPKNVAAVADLVRFFFLGVSWAQFEQGLGDKDSPEWDIPALRQKGDAALAELLPPEDPLVPMLREGKLTGAMQTLSDPDLKDLCDKAYAIRLSRPAVPGQPQLPSPCLKGGLGVDEGGEGLGIVRHKLFGSRNQVLGARLDEIRKDLEKEGRPPFRTYVFGHTHWAEEEFRPLGPPPAWNPAVLNDGAWQRVGTPQQIARYRKATKKTAKEVLQLTPDRLPACYTYVWVPASEDRTGQVRSWLRRDGKWGSEAGLRCPQLEMDVR